MAKEAAQFTDPASGAGSADPFDAEKTAELAAATRSNRRPRYGAETISQIIGGGIDLLFERLCKTAGTRSYGALTIDDIHTEIEAFKADPNDAEADFYHTGWDTCVQAVGAARWESERAEPLERLILNNFAHLLPAVDQAPVQGKHLSRRIVDPFIQVLRQLLGPETFERYRTGCRRMVQRLRKAHGPAFTWEMAAEEPIGQAVVNDILIYICRHFSNVAKRRRWMVDHIASGMPPENEGAEQQWQFDDREFHMLMDALYFGLRTALDNDDGKQSLVKRYNSTNVALLYSTLQAIDRDYMEVMRKDGGDSL